MDDKQLPFPQDAEEEPDELLSRRDFLNGLGKWSRVVISGVALGALAAPRPAGAWVNRRGSWANRAGGGGGWANRGAGWINGHAGWINSGGNWINRGGAWVNGQQGWVNARPRGGGWVNGSRDSWVNRRGGRVTGFRG